MSRTLPTRRRGLVIVALALIAVSAALFVAAAPYAKLPLLPVEHHYLVTEAIPEIEAMGHELPTIGESEAGYYSRQEGKGILLGAYESTCHHWAFDGTPLDFGHDCVHVELKPSTRGAGDQDRASLAQLQRLEDLPRHLDLLLGMERG